MDDGDDSGSNADEGCLLGLKSGSRAGTLVDCLSPTTMTHCFEQ